MTVSARRPRLLLFVTEDYYFVSHRLPLAVAAQAHGYDVSVVTRVRECGGVVRAAGIRLLPFEVARGGLNPLADLMTLMRLAALYRRERPDIVHHVAMKPVLYGTMAAAIAGVPHVINALAGMGWMFTARSGVAAWLNPAVKRALGWALRRGIALVQNPDDERLVAALGVAPEAIRRVAGSGVDLTRFTPAAEPDGPPTVILPARLLWDKGVGEFVDAARILRRRGTAARFVLAGTPDPLNPASITPPRVSAWVDEGIIDYVGWIADMPEMLAGVHIVCLPSYREGMPKSLIEAAAAGKPIVTTDVPGCREVVRDGDNGILVPPRDAPALADALERLLASPEQRRAMGERGRRRAEAEFGLPTVLRQTLAIYAEVMR